MDRRVSLTNLDKKYHIQFDGSTILEEKKDTQFGQVVYVVGQEKKCIIAELTLSDLFPPPPSPFCICVYPYASMCIKDKSMRIPNRKTDRDRMFRKYRVQREFLLPIAYLLGLSLLMTFLTVLITVIK
jgi:hypothetical protein